MRSLGKGVPHVHPDQKPEIRKKIVDTKDLDADTMKALDAAIAEFKTQWAGSSKNQNWQGCRTIKSSANDRANELNVNGQSPSTR